MDLPSSEPDTSSDFDYDLMLHAYQHHQYHHPTAGEYYINMTKTYHITAASASKYGSLIDRGANGGLAGSDVHVLSTSGCKVSVTGIDNHKITSLDLVSCTAVINTNHGNVILIINEYAYFGQGNIIHASGQIECFSPWWR